MSDLRIRVALAAEPDHPYGEKVPRWFSAADLAGLVYHPVGVVERALGKSAPL
ncbi:MAG: hypothetical protein JXA93_16550 [Anaerolineae bacterium]|nr:hypothetical protein [Anaerolineae bacterium]